MISFHEFVGLLPEHTQNLASTTLTSCDNEVHNLTVHSTLKFLLFLCLRHLRQLDFMSFTFGIIMLSE